VGWGKGGAKAKRLRQELPLGCGLEKRCFESMIAAVFCVWGVVCAQLVNMRDMVANLGILFTMEIAHGAAFSGHCIVAGCVAPDCRPSIGLRGQGN